DLDGRVELGGRGLLGQPRGLRGGVKPRAVDQLAGLAVRLAALHVQSPVCVVAEFVVSGPAPGPATVRRAAATLPPELAVSQPSTTMPIDLAVPAMICSAASMLFAFRSGILVCAIWVTCAIDILPTLVLCGSELPFCTPAAFLISSAAGGVLVMNENVLSS